MAKKQKECCSPREWKVDWQSYNPDGNFKASGFMKVKSCDINSALEIAENKLKKKHELFRVITPDPCGFEFKSKVHGKINPL